MANCFRKQNTTWLLHSSRPWKASSPISGWKSGIQGWMQGHLDQSFCTSRQWEFPGCSSAVGQAHKEKAGAGLKGEYQRVEGKRRIFCNVFIFKGSPWGRRELTLPWPMFEPAGSVTSKERLRGLRLLSLEKGEMRRSNLLQFHGCCLCRDAGCHAPVKVRSWEVRVLGHRIKT